VRSEASMTTLPALSLLRENEPAIPQRVKAVRMIPRLYAHLALDSGRCAMTAH
jgi:hypothetical protein